MWLMRSVRGSSSSASTRRHFLSKVLNQLQVCAWLGRDQTENAAPPSVYARDSRARRSVPSRTLLPRSKRGSFL